MWCWAIVIQEIWWTSKAHFDKVRRGDSYFLLINGHMTYQNVLGFAKWRVTKRKCAKQRSTKVFTMGRKRSGTSAGEMGGAGRKASEGIRGWSLQFLLSFKSEGTNSLPQRKGLNPPSVVVTSVMLGENYNRLIQVRNCSYLFEYLLTLAWERWGSVFIYMWPCQIFFQI